MGGVEVVLINLPVAAGAGFGAGESGGISGRRWWLGVFLVHAFGEQKKADAQEGKGNREMPIWNFYLHPDD